MTFEEGVHAAWLYDLLSPHVAKVVVCDPRRNALFKSGNKSDKIDARKLAQLLRSGMLTAVYHGNHSVKALRELSRSYLCLVYDATRVMNRLKALYRGRGIPCAGQRVYSVGYRQLWLEQLREPGVRHRAELLYQHLDALAGLRRQARRALRAESRKQPAHPILREILFLGPIRVALLIAIVQTPFRFRTKRQFGTYGGWASSPAAVPTFAWWGIGSRSRRSIC